MSLQTLTLSLPLATLVDNTHTPMLLTIGDLISQPRSPHTHALWEYHDQLLKQLHFFPSSQPIPMLYMVGKTDPLSF